MPTTRMERLASSKPRALLSVDDLSSTEIADLFDAARGFARERTLSSHPILVGLLFLEGSLRTRVGFSVAAARLGGQAIDVHELRSGAAMSSPESFADTLRTLTGMVDVAVVRTPFAVDRELVEQAAVTSYVNAGDGSGEHPTQALIDLFSIEEERGPICELQVGLCGDLTMRTARSLLKLLNRFPPKGLTLFAPEGRGEPGVELTPELAERTRSTREPDFRELDILYMVGLPEAGRAGRLSADARAAFSLTSKRISELSRDAVVLSPMPVIDEIAQEARADWRVRMFAQSDRAVYVRMAVLKWARAGAPAAR